MDAEVVVKGLALGLSTGVFCTGFCYPILAPMMFSRDEHKFSRISASVGLFLLGRLIAYLLFGLVFGLLGEYFSTNSFSNTVLPIIYIILGISMILYGVVQSLKTVKTCVYFSKLFQSQKYVFFLGFLAGINICPPFLLALSTVMSFHQALNSVIFFFFFFIATSIYFLPFLFSGFMAKLSKIRLAARIISVLTGIWFIYQAISLLIS